MTTPLKTRVEYLHLVSNIEALKLLLEYGEKIREKTGTVPLLVQRVLEYLRKFSRVSIEQSEEFRGKLSSLGLRDETVVMIMNICPKTIDELRTLIIPGEKISERELSDLLNTVNQYCRD